MPRRPQSTPTSREPARRHRTQTGASATPVSNFPPGPAFAPVYALPHLTSEQLGEIRRNLNWRLLFTALGLQRDEQKSKPDDWWARSPLKPTERTASFHMTDAGWFCFSTGLGGSSLELIQQLNPGFNAYDAGRWLLERGISTISGETRSGLAHALAAPGCPPPPPPPLMLPPLPVFPVPPPPPLPPAAYAFEVPVSKPAAEHPAENLPIRQDLRSVLDPTHPAFLERGIPVETLRELGIGFWQRKRPRKGNAPDLLNGRLIFQIRGVRRARDGSIAPVILSHMGRAVTHEQETQGGKWCLFRGFRKIELYNIDLALLDPEAREQAQSSGHVLVTEGCFDVAKLWSAGIKNVVASLGSHISRDQIPRFQLMAAELKIRRFLIFYDRDQDGTHPHGLGASNAVTLLQESGFQASAFDWNRTFESGRRGNVRIPTSIADPAEFSIDQIKWLRKAGCI